MKRKKRKIRRNYLMKRFSWWRNRKKKKIINTRPNSKILLTKLMKIWFGIRRLYKNLKKWRFNKKRPWNMDVYCVKELFLWLSTIWSLEPHIVDPIIEERAIKNWMWVYGSVDNVIVVSIGWLMKRLWLRNIIHMICCWSMKVLLRWPNIWINRRLVANKTEECSMETNILEKIRVRDFEFYDLNINMRNNLLFVYFFIYMI